MPFSRVLGLLALAVPSLTWSQPPHRVVVDLFSGGLLAYKATLGNVENLQKTLGTDAAEVEIVCYGPGIDLILSHDNPLASRVRALHLKGVEFAACQNTLHARHIGTDRILPFVRVVDAGIAEVVRKEEAGWSYLRR